MNVLLTDDQRVKIANTDDLYQIMRSILVRENGLNREKSHWWVIGLRNDWFIDFIELMHVGDVILLEPDLVFSTCVARKVPRVIVAHNVDNGNYDPTELDKGWTEQMANSGRILKKTLIDHMIFDLDGYKNFI